MFLLSRGPAQKDDPARTFADRSSKGIEKDYASEAVS
jgi:hypothetical protein